MSEIDSKESTNSYGDFSDPTDREPVDSIDSHSHSHSTNGHNEYSSSPPANADSAYPSSTGGGGGGGGGGAGRLPNLAFKLYVGNLPSGASEKDVENVFVNSSVPCAPPTRIDMKNGYAFVHFERNDGLDEALPQLNGMDLNGSKVRIEWSKPQTTRCFNCKQDGHWARDCPSGDSRGGSRHGAGRDRSYGGGRDRRDRDRSPGRYSSYRDRSPRRYSPRRSPPRDYHHGHPQPYDPYRGAYGPPPTAYMPPPYYPPGPPPSAPPSAYSSSRDAPYASSSAAASYAPPPAQRYY